MIISPAMMKVFEECQKKYLYMYVDKINLPQNKYFFEKGKNIHAMANYFLKGYDISKLENALSDEEKNIWNYLKNIEYFKFDTVNSEYQLSCKIEDYWIGGRLDALVKNNEDYYILDYKTGSIPQNPEYDYQTIVYLLCTDKLLKKYNTLNFVYIDLKNKDEKIIKLTDKFKSEYSEKLKQILLNISLVKNNPSIAKKNIKCKCDYYYICE